MAGAYLQSRLELDKRLCQGLLLRLEQRHAQAMPAMEPKQAPGNSPEPPEALPCQPTAVEGQTQVCTFPQVMCTV